MDTKIFIMSRLDGFNTLMFILDDTNVTFTKWFGAQYSTLVETNHFCSSIISI